MAADEINPVTGQVFYSRNVDAVTQICRVLKIGDGRLSAIGPDRVHFFMDLVERSIDDILYEYYFTPIREYNHVMPNGTLQKMFPGRLRRIAQYWAAGLMLQSEFQTLEPNTNETCTTYIEDAKKECYQVCLFNQRLPGQVYKSGWSKTMLPNMQPGLPPSENW